MALSRPGLSPVGLPLEIIQDIGFKLRLKDSVRCSLVSKAWNQAIHHNHFWKVLCRRDFCLVSQQATGYEELYRRFHFICSSLVINPQPITLKGMKNYNPQLTYIYSGKTGIVPQFTPLAEIGEGKAIKNLYQKVSKNPQKLEKWVGKIGDPLTYVLRGNPHTLRTREKIEMDIDSLREKLASDLYQELGRGFFIVPKTRISSQPIVNQFTKSHGLIPHWVSKFPECLRFMSLFMGEYQDLNRARVMKNVSFLEFIQVHQCFPPTLLTEEGVSVPLQGLHLILSLDRILSQKDSLETLQGKIGWIWIHDKANKVVKAQAVQLEPHSTSIVGLKDLSQALTIEKSTFRSFIKTHRRFPDKILTPQGTPVVLRGGNQLSEQILENPKILEINEGQLGFIWIQETYQDKIYIESAQIIKINPLSRTIEGFHEMGQARHDLSFMDYIELYHRPPEAILSPAGSLVPLKGMMSLLAIARILADVDVLGGGGGNAGFRWEEDSSQNIIGARIVKIDPGFCFSWGEESSIWNWTIRKQKGISSFPPDFRDLQTATQKESILVHWKSLTPLQKQEFLFTFLNTTRYLNSPQVFHFLFHREGRFIRSELESLPDYFLEEKQTQLRFWTESQQAIYQEDLESLKCLHPEHLLRIYYLDHWGELSLPMAEETFPIHELYTQLKIIQEEEMEKPLLSKKLGSPETFSGREMAKGDALDFFPFSTETKTVELSDIFPTESGPRKVLLLGKAGIGKSTLCKKIANDWSLKKLWNNRFDMVYWVPLRLLSLLKINYQDSDQWMAEVLTQLIFKGEISQDLILQLVRQHRSKSLWILDGYDEATPELQAWIAQLLQEKDLSILVASRPGVAEVLVSCMDLQVENVGFSDAQIEIYAKQFFGRKATPLDPEPFLEKLKRHRQLFEIAHIPLQMQMLCSLWEQKKETFASHLTEIYFEMVALLLGRNGKKLEGYATEDLLLALEKIAEAGLESRQLVIPQGKITEVLSKTSIPLRVLLETGLLKDSPDQSSYTFLHLSFQEFLTALFLVTLSENELRTRLRSYRDDPTYHLTLIFLGGILAKQTPQKGMGFFEALTEDDVTWTDEQQKSRLTLCLKCLNEWASFTDLSVPSLNRALAHHLTIVKQFFKEAQWLYHLPATLKSLYTNHPSLLGTTNDSETSFFIQVCSIGNLELGQWLWSQEPTLFQHAWHGNFVPLHAAAGGGHFAMAEWLYSKDPSLIDKRTKYGETPLHFAARGGHVTMAEWLYLKKPSLIDMYTWGDSTPLHEAARNGHIVMAEWLYLKKPSLISKLASGGWTALYSAIQNGQVKMAEWLYSKDPHSLTSKIEEHRWFPLRSSIKDHKTHVAMAKWLYSKDPSFITNVGEDGRTSLHFAALNRNVAMAKWLHSKDPSLITKVDVDGWTPLHSAAHMGCVEVAEWLYATSPSLIDKITKDGRNPFHLTVRRGYVQMAEWLYSKDPAFITRVDKGGWTPLHFAIAGDRIFGVQEAQVAMINWLCSKSPSLISTPTKDGMTPFHLATYHGDLNIAKWLYTQVPTFLHQFTNHGWTPLHAAAQGGHLVIVQWLCSQDSTLLHQFTNSGVTPLHEAAEKGHLVVAQWLCSQDAALLRKFKKDGWTPLHAAAQEGHVEMSQWLCTQNPGQVTARTKQGNTPFNTAQRSGKTEIADWLRTHYPEGCKEQKGCTIS